jgi:hypothetical protein
MNLDKIILQVQKHHNWTLDYSIKVSNEYTKFMFLRSKNNKLSPSNEIDKFWHQHILNTNHYYNFCTENFGKFIHHDPEDANDQIKRIERLNETTKNYKDLYKSNPPVNVWNGCKDGDEEQDKKRDVLIIKLINTFDIYKDGKYVGKGTRINSGYKFDGRVFKVKKNGTLQNLSNELSRITEHPTIAIKFYEKYNDYHNEKGWNRSIDKNTPLDKFNNLIVILEEMSSNGYC